MVNLDLYAWVVRGSQRIAVIKALIHPTTPTLAFKKAKEYHNKISLNNTSSVLRTLAKMGLVICINDDAKTGRIYELTEEGKEIQDELIRR